ncbi:MAG: hypothetical protein LBG52_03695 [Candidatus Peribacteria bacterium]|jgi:hypothetical protein|nr:hypothetical protein [Candidatus Peribacteria bacterium]
MIRNFKETAKTIVQSYGNVLGGRDTPESAYKTGRSAALIVLTLFPGGVAKLGLKVGKW